MSDLRPAQISHLKRLARDLAPRVSLGKAGFTDGVQAQLDAALSDSELVKLRCGRKVDVDVHAMADALNAVCVQTVGHVVVLYRAHGGAVTAALAAL